MQINTRGPIYTNNLSVLHPLCLGPQKILYGSVTSFHAINANSFGNGIEEYKGHWIYARNWFFLERNSLLEICRPQNTEDRTTGLWSKQESVICVCSWLLCYANISPTVISELLLLQKLIWKHLCKSHAVKNNKLKFKAKETKERKKS